MATPRQTAGICTALFALGSFAVASCSGENNTPLSAAGASSAGSSGDGAGGSPSNVGGQPAGSGNASAAAGASGAAGPSGGDSGAGFGGMSLVGGAAGMSAAGTGGANTGGFAGTSGGTATGPGLVPSPSELVFAAVQRTDSALQTFTLENSSTQSARLASVMLDATAAGTASFELISGPQAGTEVPAGGKATMQVRFHPSGVAEFQSALLVQVGSPTPGPLKVGLYGLGTKGLEGANEPFLKSVLNTLGFAVNVGGTGLLGTNAKPVGSEVAAPRFKAASSATPIELIPVARYSPQELIPYGYYSGTNEVRVGAIASDQFQALNPATDATSKRSFAAPAGDFGIYTSSMTHKTYTEDGKNAANATKHAVRSFPLRDRAGNAIPNSYLLCFEEAANGDYQDYVFTLSNVVPVAP